MLLPAAALALAACHAERPAPADSLPAIAVHAVVAERKARPSTEEVVGTVRAKLRAVIEAKVSARIEALLVAPGQTVKAGELLARLDAREIQAKLDQALAVRDQAARDLGRARDLMEKRVTTQAEFDPVQARERSPPGPSGNGNLARLHQGDRALRRHCHAQARRRWRSRYARQTHSRVEDPRALRLEADVPEALIGHVNLGATLPVLMSATARQYWASRRWRRWPTRQPHFSGEAGSARRGGREKRTIRARLGGTGEAQSIRVPAKAVQAHGQMEIVFIANQQHAQLRIVRTGKRADGEVELLAGVEPGDRVIVEGAEPLRDGQPITITP